MAGARGHSGFITLRYHVTGDVGQIVVPPSAEPGRADGLWKTTCFELFTRDEGDENYREYNFSPSGQWAAFGFSTYREGMCNIPIWAPRISTTVAGRALMVEVTFVSPRLGPQRVGACAVIEEKDGAKSFWALTHPSDTPDFHNSACFDYVIPAPEA